jgi:LacI family transcriptional regulator, galactose operon repressor
VRVRMKDIAREMGLSAVTISKALRNHPDVSNETRKRILKRMQELNYQPNFAARALITGRTWTVGLVVPDLLHPFFAQIAKALGAKIRKQGYGLLISSSEDDPELERREIENLLARRVDVLLIASAQWTVEAFRMIEEQKVPYVLIDRRFIGLAANFVGVDDETVGMLATSHLIEQGCKRIAHIRGPEVSTATGRIEGYKRALAFNNLASFPDYIVPIGKSGDDRGEVAGYEAATKLLSGEPRPDGIFCYNDAVALGTMRSVLDSGLRIPEDVAVIGCGNFPHSEFLRVPLSTIDQDSQSIGERGAELALSLVASKAPVRPRTELIGPRLVVRASSERKQVDLSQRRA